MKESPYSSSHKRDSNPQENPFRKRHYPLKVKENAEAKDKEKREMWKKVHNPHPHPHPHIQNGTIKGGASIGSESFDYAHMYNKIDSYDLYSQSAKKQHDEQQQEEKEPSPKEVAIKSLKIVPFHSFHYSYDDDSTSASKKSSSPPLPVPSLSSSSSNSSDDDELAKYQTMSRKKTTLRPKHVLQYQNQHQHQYQHDGKTIDVPILTSRTSNYRKDSIDPHRSNHGLQAIDKSTKIGIEIEYPAPLNYPSLHDSDKHIDNHNHNENDKDKDGNNNNNDEDSSLEKRKQKKCKHIMWYVYFGIILAMATGIATVWAQMSKSSQPKKDNQESNVGPWESINDSTLVLEEDATSNTKQDDTNHNKDMNVTSDTGNNMDTDLMSADTLTNTLTIFPSTSPSTDTTKSPTSTSVKRGPDIIFQDIPIISKTKILNNVTATTLRKFTTTPTPTATPTTSLPSLSPTTLHPTMTPTTSPTHSPSTQPSVSPSQEAPTQTPSMSPSMTFPPIYFTSDSQDTVEFISSIVLDPTLLKDHDSPYYNTLIWFLEDLDRGRLSRRRLRRLEDEDEEEEEEEEEDEDNVYLRSPSLLEGPMKQRFVIMLMYFSLKGDKWRRNDGYGTSTHECTWEGIICNSEDEIIEINLGK